MAKFGSKKEEPKETVSSANVPYRHEMGESLAKAYSQISGIRVEDPEMEALRKPSKTKSQKKKDGEIKSLIVDLDPETKDRLEAAHWIKQRPAKEIAAEAIREWLDSHDIFVPKE